jgi:hypothetical protein
MARFKTIPYPLTTCTPMSMNGWADPRERGPEVDGDR